MRTIDQARQGPSGQTGPMPTGRDRLRELLDAVLDAENPTLAAMAADTYSSPFHFARQLSREAGEGPVAMRRRVLLERAAWQLAGGATVTDAALEAGYDSVEGFSRAFARSYGTPPSRLDGAGHWLPAPNGIHFHPPTSLWVAAGQVGLDPISGVLTQHDVADTAVLLRVAADLPADELRRVRHPGLLVLPWDGVEESIIAVLGAVVWTKQVWLASIDGEEAPERPGDDAIEELIIRHERLGARWLSTLQRLDHEQRWNDRLIDALCDPPESFLLAGVVAHVISFSTYRRHLVRRMIAELGHPVDSGDPLEWLNRRHRRADPAPQTPAPQTPAPQTPAAQTPAAQTPAQPSPGA